MKPLLSLSFLLVFSAFSFCAFSQNYSSIADGNWTTASRWNNTSGWGTATPPLTGQGSGTISINHNITIATNYNSGSATLNISAGKTLTINGNLTVAGGSTINVSGILIITGTATLNSNLRILPGGAVYVSGTLTVNSSPYLTVGTNVAPPPYADLIAYGNIVSSGSGDITVNRNGRVAAFGNITGTGGGSLLTVNNGGQVYVHGNINFSGGGSSIVNNNTTSPYGLYVNGTTTNSGGGSTSTSNTGDETTMQNTNPTLYSWISNIPLSPLPVVLLYFKGEQEGSEIILNWATASEKNADYFLIERSRDGNKFMTIDTVAAFGNTSLKQLYHLIDPQPLTGRNYYRLKQVDHDSKHEYFNIVLVEFTSSRNINVYPTHLYAGEELKIEMNFSSEKNIDAGVFNLSGQLVSNLRVNEAEIRYTPNLGRGVYIIRLNVGSEVFTKKFIVK